MIRSGIVPRPPSVAQRVLGDLVDVLSGVGGDAGQHHVAGVAHVCRLDLDVLGGAADAAGTLVEQCLRMRQGEALTGGAGGQQELAGTVGHADVHRGDVVGDGPHGVAGGEQQQGGAQSVGGVLLQGVAEDDAAAFIEVAVDFLVEYAGGVGCVL